MLSTCHEQPQYKRIPNSCGPSFYEKVEACAASTSLPSALERRIWHCWVM